MDRTEEARHQPSRWDWLARRAILSVDLARQPHPTDDRQRPSHLPTPMPSMRKIALIAVELVIAVSSMIVALTIHVSVNTASHFIYWAF